MPNVTMTKPSANIQLIPAKSVCRESPALAKNTNDTGGVSIDCDDPPEATRIVKSDYINALCAAAIESSSCAAEKISASIEPSPDAPVQSMARDSPLRMRGSTHDGDGELEVGDVRDEGANGEVSSERQGVDAVTNGDDDGDKVLLTSDGELEDTDATMTNVANAEEVEMVVLQSEKQFASPTVLENGGAGNYMSIGGAPWFDMGALAVEGFLDHYEVDSWLPGELLLEWTRCLASRNQCACHEDALVKRRGVQLIERRLVFCDKVN